MKALLRMAVVWNIPVACNRAPADFMISSPLMGAAYDRLDPDYDAHIQRDVTAPQPDTGGLLTPGRGLWFCAAAQRAINPTTESGRPPTWVTRVRLPSSRRR